MKCLKITVWTDDLGSRMEELFNCQKKTGDYTYLRKTNLYIPVLVSLFY